LEFFFAFCIESENVLVDRSLMDEESNSTHEYDDMSDSDTSEDWFAKSLSAEGQSVCHQTGDYIQAGQEYKNVNRNAVSSPRPQLTAQHVSDGSSSSVDNDEDGNDMMCQAAVLVTNQTNEGHTQNEQNSESESAQNSDSSTAGSEVHVAGHKADNAGCGMGSDSIVPGIRGHVTHHPEKKSGHIIGTDEMKTSSRIIIERLLVSSRRPPKCSSLHADNNRANKNNNSGPAGAQSPKEITVTQRSDVGDEYTRPALNDSSTVTRALHVTPQSVKSSRITRERDARHQSTPIADRVGSSGSTSRSLQQLADSPRLPGCKMHWTVHCKLNCLYYRPISLTLCTVW
jgi:hypothetical protein